MESKSIADGEKLIDLMFGEFDEVAIAIVSHGSANPSCNGFVVHAQSASEAKHILRNANRYRYCPRCGQDNHFHGTVSLQWNFEVRTSK
jgi:hypothetical protein